MVAPEGRKDLLKVLYERMPQEVLDELTVVFDFNCQEGEYMLNRVPSMCAHIRLLIDHWHSRAHKCPSMFKMDAYPLLQSLISTSSESLNNIMQHLHSQTPFMSMDTYVIVISGIMGVRNKLLNDKMSLLINQYKNKEDAN